MAEPLPGNRPEIQAVKRRPGEWPEIKICSALLINSIVQYNCMSITLVIHFSRKVNDATRINVQVIE